MSIISHRKLDNPLIQSLLIFGAVFLFLLPLALNRFYACDEGFYLYAGQLVSQGQTPYLDFYYPQMPYLPYILALAGQVFGMGILGFRLFNLVVVSLSAVLLYRWTFQITRHRFLSLLALLFFLFHIQMIYTLLTLKTYSFTLLFAMASLMAGHAAAKKGHAVGLLCAGVLASLAFGIRLTLLPVYPVLLFVTWFGSKERPLKNMILAAAGMAAGALPMLYFILIDFDAFWFNNVGFHALRNTSQAELVGDIMQKIKVMLGLVGHSYPKGGIGSQNLILILLILLFGLRLKKISLLERTAGLFGLLMIGISLLPTPTHFFYYSIPVPFLIILGMAGASRENARPSMIKRGLILVFVFYTLLGVPDGLYCLHLYKQPQSDMAGGSATLSDKSDLEIAKINEINAYLKNNDNNDRVILSFFAGYLLGTENQPLPGSENHVALQLIGNISRNLPEEKLNKYHLLNETALENAIRDHKPDLIVLPQSATEWMFSQKQVTRWNRVAAEAGYRPVKTFGKIVIYQKPTSQG